MINYGIINYIKWAKIEVPDEYLKEKGGGRQMKIRTRLAIAFLIITVVPMTLIYLAVRTLNNYQGKAFSETYGLNEQVDLSSGVSIDVFSRLTEAMQMEIDAQLEKNTEIFLDFRFLDAINEKLVPSHSFLAVTKGTELIYTGNANATYELNNEISAYANLGTDVPRYHLQNTHLSV